MEWWLIVIIVIASIIAVIVTLLIILKLYAKFTVGQYKSRASLFGKTAIVTGANTGIGFYTAQDFASRGAKVILACRDPIRAEEAREKIVEATGNPNVIVRILDLGSLASVRQFAKEIITTEERLDILVNNAGAGGFDYQITKDGLSLSMHVNHFGPFLLTLLLIGLLKKSAPSRIVNVSSRVAKFAKLNLNDLNEPSEGTFAKARDYANTKLCNILITNELARRLKGSGIVANSLHPGAVQTDFSRHLSNTSRKMFMGMAKMFYKTAEEGAQTSIYLAVSEDVKGVSGEYFADCKKASMPKDGRDEELAKKVWEKSEEFVQLTPEERQI